MIGLLIVAAIATTVALVSSSFRSISAATGTDTSSRGPWGVLDWDWKRTRHLDAHERRWETSLISGRKQPARWPELIEAITELERAADVSHDPEPPDSFDAKWVEARLRRLEDHQRALQQKAAP